MAFDRLGDIVVHHHQTGPADAPPLVFVNSLGTDLRVWDALLPKLADRFCCVRYDKRGHGLTDATAQTLHDSGPCRRSRARCSMLVALAA